MGGDILGVPVLPTDGLPAGILALADANAIAVADDGLQLDQSSQAGVQLDTAPTNPPTTPVNLFQQNMVALRAERKISVQALSSNSRAYVTGVT